MLFYFRNLVYDVRQLKGLSVKDVDVIEDARNSAKLVLIYLVFYLHNNITLRALNA